VIFHALTIFPEFFGGLAAHGVVKRAQDAGIIEIRVHNLRDWTSDRHKTVDDRPFGGGEGMVLKPEPIFRAAESIWGSVDPQSQWGGPPGLPSLFPSEPDQSACPIEDAQGGAGAFAGQPNRRIVLLSAQGRLFDQPMANRLSQSSEILLICGRYEGVDERVAEHLADEEISIGSYVLSGGELAAAVVIDAVARLLPGVLGNEKSAEFESFQETGHGEGLLDCPHWTRPAEFRGWKAPDVLLNGNHEEIRRFRKQAALEKTARLRPDLIK
jgi:tRNA (guanine37-N1)-methyltransferase